MMIQLLRQVLLVFAGALLLFLIQPIAGQRLLAPFGGSPAVWLACLMFFQALLFLGYLWVYLLTRFPNLHFQIGMQSALLIWALLQFMPVNVAGQRVLVSSYQPLEAFLSLVSDLAIPILCVASVSPLVQSWAAQTTRRRAPYWLYAYSNLASLLALALYPFWIQDRWKLGQQLQIWTWAFYLFTALFAWNMLAILWQLRQRELPDRGIANRQPDHGHSASLGRIPSHPVIWVLASLLPSVLLMAISNQISSDVAAGPVFWTLPLASYLATYTLAFAWPGKGRSPLLLPIMSLLLMVLCPILVTLIPATVTVVMGCAGLFGVSLTCHRLLAGSQPSGQQLPSYYLWIAAGGLCGGILTNLVAPLVFSNYYELELAALATGGFLYWAARRSSPSKRVSGTGRMTRLVTNLLTLGVMAIGLLGLYIKSPWLRERGRDGRLVEQVRTFHGVLRILERETPQGTIRIFGHGATDHGRRNIDGAIRDLPSGYYAVGSGLAAAFYELRQNPERRLEVCIMGLGAGNMVAWKEPGDRFVFVEIDPEVIRLQQQYFPWDIPDTELKMISDDARHYLRQSEDAAFDLIVMDAFTGDSVPTHLLTRQAIEIYLEKLRLDGVLAIHISNRYLDFSPVVARLASEYDLEMVAITHRPGIGQSTKSLRECWNLAGTGTSAPWLAHLYRLTDPVVDPRRSSWILLGRVPFSSRVSQTADVVDPDDISNVQPEPYLWEDDYTPILRLTK